MLNKIMKIIKRFINRRVLEQLYFNFLNLFLFKDSQRKLARDGFCQLSNIFPLEEINFEKYLDYKDFNFDNNRKKIEINDLKIVYLILNKIGCISILKKYLGENIYCYDNTILTLGNKKSFEGSWQPHHDSKGRRIKIYIWLNKKNLNTHPLFYLKGSHKIIRNWHKYEDTRFRDIDAINFNKIYGDTGDVILFDTHGIHSHFKDSTVPRSVVELTFEGYGFFQRLNKKNISNEIKRLGMIKLDELVA
tara:strand:+ start:988 stop:1731 length:744 start_codon:yes stop_codon:yes gene_type:complete